MVGVAHPVLSSWEDKESYQEQHPSPFPTSNHQTNLCIYKHISFFVSSDVGQRYLFEDSNPKHDKERIV